MNGLTAPRPTYRTKLGALAAPALVLAILGALTLPVPVTADRATVRAVLFYSPSCPHCHQVLEDGLPPIEARFRDQLEVLLVDASAARIGLFAVAAAGTLFSVYLTFLEPFVIGSTCAWCLASAVLMATILVMAAVSLSRRVPIRAAQPDDGEPRGRDR